MAKEKEKPKSEREGKKGKKHLHQIITTKARDGSFGHEHVYRDHADDSAPLHPPVFAGTSRDMEDLHQHMDDHFGGGAAEGGGEAPEAAEAGPAPEAPESEPGPEAA